jgi:asparagine synthase (glutamine-hydrolysing)
VKPWISASFAARTHLEERLGRAPPTGPVIRSEAKQLVANLLTTSYNAVFALEWNDLVAARLGLEKRHPYWDRRLAEFCLAIPESVRVGEGGADQVTKLLLRRSLCGILPEAIARRRSKPAFDEVSRQEITVLQAPGVDAAIAEARLERLQVLVPGAEQRLLAAYRLGNARAAAPLTTVLGLELWLLNLEEDLHGP